MKLIYQDKQILVCTKPGGVLSTDEPGGMPDLIRAGLGDKNACVRTVHRLDRVVGGLMVFARTPKAASELSRQIRERTFDKEYLAVVHGAPETGRGTYRDLLLRSKQERKTYVVHHMEKGVQEAILDYEVLGKTDNLTLVRITLRTGRTHQIRSQFSSRDLPLVGDRKYSTREDNCQIALWSYRLAFRHPGSRQAVEYRCLPPAVWPWTEFQNFYDRE